MKIVSWNMNRLARSRENHTKAWEYLRDKLGADVALVQEASPPEGFGPRVYRPIDEARYNWGSAVVALRGDVVLRERPRLPLASCYLDPPTGDQLPDSHPGACAVADVLDASGKVRFTAISLYGQWEVMADGTTMDACARLHRMLSDLTGVLLPSRRRPVVLAGDLNISTQWSRPAKTKANVEAAFARIRALGLVDCVATRAGRSPLPACSCGQGDACSHVQTFRSQNRVDSDPTQLDYAFVSEAIVSTVTECKVVQTDVAWQFSDHCPIVVDIDEHLLGAC